jgi:hypothetical protein
LSVGHRHDQWNILHNVAPPQWPSTGTGVTVVSAIPRTGGRLVHSWKSLNLAEKIAVVIAPIGIAISLLAWLRPQAAPTPNPQPSVSIPGPTTGNSSPPGLPSSPPPSAAPPPSWDYLAGSVLSPEAGGDRVVRLPRELRTRDEYTSHPLTVKCPSNQTGDSASEITYDLRGQYLRLDATVRPFYPDPADQRAITHVTVAARYREADGELTTKDVGRQLAAEPGGEADLSAAFDGAQKLVLRVQCSDPDGIIVLTDARLTPRD